MCIIYSVYLSINSKDKITNKELWNTAEQYSMETTITRRNWTWIGHTMRKAGSSITNKKAMLSQGNHAMPL